MQLSVLDEKIDSQGETGWLILGKVKASIGMLSDIKRMLGMISQWVMEQKRYRATNKDFWGPDACLDKPMIFEDALGNILEIPSGWIDSWAVSTPPNAFQCRQLNGSIHRCLISS
jgi:hypothetical protein